MESRIIRLPDMRKAMTVRGQIARSVEPAEELASATSSGAVIACPEQKAARRPAAPAFSKARTSPDIDWTRGIGTDLAPHLISLLSDGFSVMNVDGKLVEVNQAFCRMTGFSREELLGTGRHHPYWPPEQAATIDLALTAAVSGETDDLDLTFMRKSGERFPVIVSPTVMRNDDGEIVLCFSTYKDITQRKQAEEALRRSEQEHRTLFETMVQGVVYQDADGVIVSANPAAERILGTPLHEMIGVPSTDPRWRSVREDGSPYPVDEHPSVVALRTGREVRDEIMGIVNPATGALTWILIHATPQYRSGESRPFRVFIAFWDVTEQRRQEQALRESEELLRGVFDTMTSGVAIIEVSNNGIEPSDYLITSTNRATRAIEGDGGDCAGSTLESVSQMVESGLFDAIKRVWETGEPSFFPLMLYDDDGQLASCHEFRIFRLPTGQIVAIYDDVTKRTRAELELHDRTRELDRQKQLLATLLDTIPSPVYYKDARGLFLGCNRSYEEMFGIPERELVGRGLEVFGLPRETDMFARMDQELCATAGTRTYESNTTVADGSMRHLINKKATYTDSSGTVAGLVGIAIDITERKRAEDTVAASAQRLSRSLRETVRAMGAIVELRDPYTGDHERRSTRLAVAIARELGLDDHRLEGLQLAGEVHDVGKIGVPAEILSRPGALANAEMQLVRRHAALGAEILSGIHFDWPIADIVRQHHERIDGSGYPGGLRSDQILLEARILAVADVVEAMMSHRPYRPALGLQPALREIRSGAGLVYDPEVVAACERVLRRGEVALD